MMWSWGVGRINHLLNDLKSIQNKSKNKIYSNILEENHFLEENHLLEMLDKTIKFLHAQLFCSFCKTEMVSEILEMNVFGNKYICEKCAYNIKSYRARICDNCDYPRINCHLIIKEQNNIFSECSAFSVNCKICSKYQYKLAKDGQTDFFKMDFVHYNNRDSDSDSDNGSDNDFDCRCGY